MGGTSGRWESLRRRLARVHPAPTFLLGSQKSGTTAIAALLGKCTGLPTTLDLQNEFRHEQNYHKVCAGELSLEAFIASGAQSEASLLNNKDFANTIRVPVVGALSNGASEAK